ncbi:heavy metal-binding domain-containing protein [Lactobacillaceae bacterium 24-114]
MFFKSKEDQESLTRAEKMYGSGINRGLAGFVSSHKEKKETWDKDKIVVVTTNDLPGYKFQVRGELITTISQEIKTTHREISSSVYQESVEKLRNLAEEKGANAVLGLNFDSNIINNDTIALTAYGTAVKIIN